MIWVILALVLAIVGWTLWRDVRSYSLTTSTGASAPAVPATGGTATPPNPPPQKWYWRYFWSIVVAVAGLGLAVWAFLAQPRPAAVGSASWDFWLVILIIWGALAAIIALNKGVLKEAAGTLQWILAIAVFAVLVGIPAVYGVRDAFLPTKVCGDGSSSELRSCVLNTAWSSWIKPAEGTATDGMNLCYNPATLVELEYRVVNGTSFYRFRAKEGEVPVRYLFKRLPDGGKCPEI